MMEPRRRATIDQQKSIRTLEGAGTICTRALDTEQVVHVVAIGSTDIVLIRIASHEWPHPDEIEQFRELRCPSNVRKLIHRWRERALVPE